MAKDKRFFQLVQQDDTADLYIFGDISKYVWDEGDASGLTIVKQLRGLDAKTINVHINSYGGDVSEGLAIYNVLKEHPAAVHTICDGFACSAASVVFMAGDQRTMAAASLLMIHNAWTYAMGNAAALRKTADDIEIITQASVEAYKCVAKISEDEIKRLMDAESWILPDDAIAYGFATDVDRDDDEDGDPMQSAFGLICQRLTTGPALLKAEEAITEGIDLSELADDIAERVSEKLADRVKAKETKPAQDKGWAKFFGK